MDQAKIQKNPVKKLRESLGYSQEELSFQSGINRQVIVRAEQGLYVSIPPRLASYLSARSGRNSSDLNVDYITWVAQRRLDAFGRISSELPAFSIEEHPFIVWRQTSELSRIDFAKLFCVHLSTLARFETELRQQTVPDQLEDALIQSGYHLAIIAQLEVRYELYREWQLALKSNNVERLIAVQMRLPVAS